MRLFQVGGREVFKREAERLQGGAEGLRKWSSQRPR